MLGQLLTSAEVKEVRGSREGRWTWSSMLRKTQHVKCILRATSDGWQACMHGIRSRRRAVTEKRWTLYLLLLRPSEQEWKKMNEKLTALFIGILWFQSCGKHFRCSEDENSRTRMGFNTFMKEATRWGSSIAWIPKIPYCIVVPLKDTLVGIW